GPGHPVGGAEPGVGRGLPALPGAVRQPGLRSRVPAAGRGLHPLQRGDAGRAAGPGVAGAAVLGGVAGAVAGRLGRGRTPRALDRAQRVGGADRVAGAAAAVPLRAAAEQRRGPGDGDRPLGLGAAAGGPSLSAAGAAGAQFGVPRDCGAPPRTPGTCAGALLWKSTGSLETEARRLPVRTIWTLSTNSTSICMSSPRCSRNVASTSCSTSSE